MTKNVPVRIDGIVPVAGDIANSWDTFSDREKKAILINLIMRSNQLKIVTLEYGQAD